MRSTAYVSALLWVFTHTFSLSVGAVEVSIASDGGMNMGYGGSCWITRPYDPASHKEVYTVGVLAIRGFEAAYSEFNKTFSDYLTATAGKRFDPPIRFEMKPLNFRSLFTDTEKADIDYIYVNPSAFSCIESEYEARSLVSQISKRVVGGDTFFLNKFGGVITARADNEEIQTIEDLKGKIIAAASISGLGSGQMQFRVLHEAGISYINDPKQLVFTSNQGKVVNGVLNGEFDVGFVRTDQLERTKGADGNLVNTSLFKIIDPKPNLNTDGVPFPFQSSTPLYPEWNIAALSHVPGDVNSALQNAMLAIADHARIATQMQSCQSDFNDTYCDALNFPNDFASSSSARCDTSKEVAEIALQAMADGKYAGWTTTLSYMQLRSMQEATGFIAFDKETKVWQCVRSAELYDSITCPEGLLKKTRKEVDAGCPKEGLICKEGYQCICEPCYTPFECVDSAEVFGRCVEYSVLLSSILVPLALLSFAACLCVVSHKSSQLVKQAEKAANNERELNEFIAHEVRNPLSAALSACAFVNAAVQGKDPITSDEDRASLREDVGVIELCLQFINELLRSMLDVHRATNDQMTIEQGAVGLLHDIFEPVSSMIYKRDANFVVLLECSETLVVQSDRLRLHQIVLNLARNSAKFVEEGFIRLRADVIDNSIQIFIEDSGPGIPEEKRAQLFSRFQSSLDILAQGTGVGLNLCKQLVDLMGGEISLDETYVSGYKDFPGTRIVINLKKAPMDVRDQIGMLPSDEPDSDVGAVDWTPNTELPPQMSVLFVDDDRILRKQGVRAISRLLPDWKIREAANGETALALVETEWFDLIFIDQYMTSVEHSLLGTETVRAIRSKGVGSVVCGLSANDVGPAFLSAGADAFNLKPFPCKEEELRPLLKKLLSLAEAEISTTSSTDKTLAEENV